MLYPNGSKQRPQQSSPFGYRWHPIQKVWKLHAGADLIGFTMVRAIAAGTVVRVGVPGGWSAGGQQVWIQHDGFLTRSMHLATGTFQVRVGDRVVEGQALGVMGMTGGATGIHLHLEIVVNGRQVDPMPFLAERVASTSGGGTTPTPVPTPTPEEIMASAGLYYEHAKNHIVYLILDTESGIFHEYSNGAGNGVMPSAYNNAIAAAFKTGNFQSITAGHAKVIKASLLAALPAAGKISDLAVTLDWDEVDVVKKFIAAQGETVAASAEALANGAHAAA